MRVRRKNSRNNIYKVKSIFKLIVFGLIVSLLVFFSFVLLKPDYWDGKSKLTVVSKDTAGNTEIVVFDPENSEIVSISIPGDTQVDVGRNLGTYKLKNVWKLGENENLDGLLLSETLTRSFKIPNFLWAEDGFVKIIHGNVLDKVRAVLGFYKTNLSTGDRLRITLFSAGVSTANSRKIDLTKSSILSFGDLATGESGYTIVGDLPLSITSFFSDTVFSKSDTTVLIIDSTGKYKVAENMGSIIEVIGAKVAGIKRQESRDIDCVISGINFSQAKKMAAYFGCSAIKASNDSSYGLQVDIGSRFSDRF